MPARTHAQWWAAVVVAVVGVVALVAELVIFAPSGTSATCAQPISVVVNSSTEKADLLNALASDYNESGRVFDGQCASVQVTKATSGTTMQRLAEGWTSKPTDDPEPQVWTPTSSLWLGQLRHQGKGALVGDAEPRSITRSVLTVAMPRQMAEVLRGRTNRPGWSDILELAPIRKGWGSVDGAKPEWGQFQLGRDNPHVSTSGLAATIAIYHAAARAAGGSEVTEADLGKAEVVRFVHDVESSVAHYGEDATLFMETLYKEDRKQPKVPYISAVVVQEQLAYLYNQGAPTGDPQQVGIGDRPNDPLVALHPNDGTIILDHPYVVLANATPDQRAAAEDFREYLLEPDRQNAFAELGFRDLEGRPGQKLAETLWFDRSESLTVIAPPTPALLDMMLKNWNAVRRKARVLLVLDVSGSMNELVDKSAAGNDLAGKSRLDLVKPAALRGIELLVDTDEVGLWTFSSASAPGQLPFTEHVPISPLRDVRQRLADAIGGLQPRGDTALYRTTKAAHTMMADSLDKDRINAIVLLSDGQDTDHDDPDEAKRALDQLLAELNADRVENSVRVFTIPYSTGNDTEALRHKDVLRQIAEVSKAATYDASNPRNIDDIFVSVFRNF